MIEILKIIGTSLVTGLFMLIGQFLSRKWQKTDKKAEVETNKDKLQRERDEKQSEKLDQIAKTLSDHIDAEAEKDARQARRRIIEFADECRRGTRHSEEHFCNVLEDIDDYERYCDRHPLFKNKKAEQSIGFILEVYDKCKHENSFI